MKILRIVITTNSHEHTLVGTKKNHKSLRDRLPQSLIESRSFVLQMHLDDNTPKRFSGCCPRSRSVHINESHFLNEHSELWECYFIEKSYSTNGRPTIYLLIAPRKNYASQEQQEDQIQLRSVGTFPASAATLWLAHIIESKIGYEPSYHIHAITIMDTVQDNNWVPKTKADKKKRTLREATNMWSS